MEEQFYLVWPTLIYFCPKRFAHWLSLGVITGALVIRNIPYFLHIQSLHDNFMYRLTPFRLDSLAFGALLAALVRRPNWPDLRTRTRSVLLFTGLPLLLLVLLYSRTVSPLATPMVRIGYTAIGLLCSALVLHAFQVQGTEAPAARLLRSGFLSRLGIYSYGIYVFHGIVRFYLPTYAQHFGPTDNRLYAAFLIFLGMLTSYFIAFCSYHAFEKHFLKLKKLFAY